MPRRKPAVAPIVPSSERPPYPDVADEQKDILSPNPIGTFQNSSANLMNGINPTLWNAQNPTSSPQPVGTPPAPPVPNNTAPIGQVNNIYQTPEGQQQLANEQNQISMPIGTARQQSTQAQSPTALGTLTPGEKAFQGYAGAAQGGLNAASQMQPTTSSGSAIGQALTAGVAGAAAGSAAGIPGAIIGGTVGLVAGGLNAYFGVNSARDQQRKQDRANREAAAWNKHMYEQNRADQLYMFEKGRGDQMTMYNTNRSDTQEQLRYNRKQAAIQSQWAAVNQARDMVNNLMTQNANYKTLLMSQTR